MLAYRFATTVDVPAIHALVESAYRGEASEQGWTSESHLLGGQRIDEGMLVDLLSTPGALVVLVERDARLVACCELRGPIGTIGDDPAIVTPDDGPVGAAYFGMFAVDPTLQGDGIGREVLAEAERIAASQLGATRMEMTVIEQRGALVGWYERRGYARTGEVKPFPYGDERFGLPKVDDLRMVVLAKDLARA
ncbi:MAG: GNAT family N-acetyltransferase [Solirubrobacteraceae bacterium]|nr:GNAT family N-acetyltransferase [Patulibacter sp.]